RPGGEEPPEPGSVLLVVAASHMPLEHDQPGHEVRPGRCGEERGVRTHRLADQYAAFAWCVVFDHLHDVGYVRCTRQVAWSAGACSVPALIDQQHPKVVP